MSLGVATHTHIILGGFLKYAFYFKVNYTDTPCIYKLTRNKLREVATIYFLWLDKIARVHSDRHSVYKVSHHGYQLRDSDLIISLGLECNNEVLLW